MRFRVRIGKISNFGKCADAAKGYTSDGVPLPETLEKFGVLDDQALDFLNEIGLGSKKDRLVSN